MTRAQADAELRVIGERTAAALAATHEHLRARVARPGEPGDSDDVELSDLAQLALTNLPVLLVLIIACTSVGTLVYAKTATREGEIALRSALGASRARIVGQLFVETLVLASLAAGIGLIAADRTLRWGIEGAYADEGGLPFWITPGLALTTILYAGALAIVTAAMLSLLPALRATRAQVQSNLANLGTGGATLRFGRVWTGAMIAQVALTAIGIPGAMEGVSQAARSDRIRAEFPSREYLAARVDVDPRFEEEATSALEERRARLFAELERRVGQEPGVLAVRFADRVPGASPGRHRIADVESSPGAGPALRYGVWTSAVGPGFFEAFDRPIVAGRAFHGGDRAPAARAVIVNEAFVRDLRLRGGHGSPIGARLRYSDKAAGATSAMEPARGARQADTAQPAKGEPPQTASNPGLDLGWLEIVGVVRDIGLDPNDEGHELPHVFRPASAATVSPLMMTVRVRGNPATLAARLPVIAADVDAGLYVQDARPLDEWLHGQGIGFAAALAALTVLVLFLSALSIYALLSVSVSRRTREIGLRAALGANPRHVLAGILSQAMVLMGSGISAGGALLLLIVAFEGPTGRPAEDVAQFAVWLAMTSAVMVAACLIACIGPARRALRINPIDALREA